MAEIKAGNKTIFEEVYHKYHQRFYFFVLKKTSSADIAEEVVQQAFIKLWEHKEKLSNEFGIDIQLARITRSILIDTLRKKAVEKKVYNHITTQSSSIFLANPSIEKELNNKVQLAIESLPPICKKIFKLSREENLSYSQIAQALSISPKTVENQISKALRIIRRVIAFYTLMVLIEG